MQLSPIINLFNNAHTYTHTRTHTADAMEYWVFCEFILHQFQ